MLGTSLERLGWSCRQILLAVAVISLLAGCSSADESVQADEAGSAVPVISAVAPCRVCSMKAAKYPQWHAQVQFQDGSTAVFDGGQCLFRYLLNRAEYDKDQAEKDISAVWVKDYNSSKWLSAGKAHYVVGSRKIGPMGIQIIAFAERQAAMDFQMQFGGSVVNYEDITPASIEYLDKMMSEM